MWLNSAKILITLLAVTLSQICRAETPEDDLQKQIRKEEKSYGLMSNPTPPSANANYLRFVYKDIPAIASTVRDPVLIKVFKDVPAAVTNHTVSYTSGGFSKALLIEGWKKKTGRDDPDAYYYRARKNGVYSKMDEEFKKMYYGLLTKDDVAADLQRRQILVNKNYLPTASTYILRENSKADGVLALSVLNVCVKNNKVSPNFAPGTIFATEAKACAGGEIIRYQKIHRLRYQPLCNGSLCKKADDVTEPWSAEQIYPSRYGTAPDAFSTPSGRTR